MHIPKVPPPRVEIHRNTLPLAPPSPTPRKRRITEAQKNFHPVPPPDPLTSIINQKRCRRLWRSAGKHHPPLRENGTAQAQKHGLVRLPTRYADMHIPETSPPIIEICQKTRPSCPGKFNSGSANKKLSPRLTSRPDGMHVSKAPTPRVAIHRKPFPFAPPLRIYPTAQAQKKMIQLASPPVPLVYIHQKRRRRL